MGLNTPAPFLFNFKNINVMPATSRKGLKDNLKHWGKKMPHGYEIVARKRRTKKRKTTTTRRKRK